MRKKTDCGSFGEIGRDLMIDIVQNVSLTAAIEIRALLQASLLHNFYAFPLAAGNSTATTDS